MIQPAPVPRPPNTELEPMYGAPVYMGPAYWIPAFWVPALLVTHYITFLVLRGDRMSAA